MQTHELKTWPGPFEAIRSGRKRHEVRVGDRPYVEGDFLLLREYDKDTDTYSGRQELVRVGYVSAGGTFGLPANLVVMSIQPVRPESKELPSVGARLYNAVKALISRCRHDWFGDWREAQTMENTLQQVEAALRDAATPPALRGMWLPEGTIPSVAGDYVRMDSDRELRLVHVGPHLLEYTGWREGAVLFRWYLVPAVPGSEEMIPG